MTIEESTVKTQRILQTALCVSLVPLLLSCASLSDSERAAEEMARIKASFKDRGQAKVARLDQDETQALCSQYPSELPKDVASKIEATNLKLMKYPADNKLLGDWREGEKIAQSGVGMQFSDDPTRPAGGNCYACHELTATEISHGTIGPSLKGFGKVRGYSTEMQRYAYGKIYNPQAYSACSNMPRFGHNGILTEEQIRHVTALLMDPQSPVNK